MVDGNRRGGGRPLRRPRKRHPIFARVYAKMSEAAELSGQAEHRRELLHGLSGRVIEVGAGNGTNFRHYPQGVTSLVAVDPEPYLVGEALRAQRRPGLSVDLVYGIAEELPIRDASFDAAVASLMLCSVDAADVALAELYRVVKPGGELRFYEHVQGDTLRFIYMQRAVDLIWPRIAGGCHTSRPTVEAISHAGFVVEQCRPFRFVPSAVAWPVAPHVIGRARRPVEGDGVSEQSAS